MSAHMTGTGGLLAIVIVLSMKFPTFKALYPLLLAILLNGIVGSARLYMDSHKPLEIYLGLIFGFLICFIGFSMLWA
jgi:membrane-associated phospholipid phosphatase